VSVIDGLPSIELAALLDRSALQHRFDRKYVVTTTTAERLLERLRDRLLVLEIDGIRRFDYESWYFDTGRLRLYHDHRQGRRRRWKARTRAYLDSRECLFEVKLKGRRGATVKERLPHPFARRGELTPESRAFLADRLAAHYGGSPPPLRTVLGTRYARTTVTDRRDATRVTLDSRLSCAGLGRHVIAPPGTMLIEVKSLAVDTVADRALRSLGVRAVSVSKYCLAAAMLEPRLPANRWNRVLRQALGWQRI
jgi:hypothetical protein